MEDKIFVIKYEFSPCNGEQRQFSVRLEKPSLQCVAGGPTRMRRWTRLEHHQFPNCLLRPEKHPDCPIAVNLANVIGSFADSLSIEEADVTIRGEWREYHKRNTVQEGISSLMGICMVTSGCPVMAKLRPMVFTHLPFATLAEALYRAISMYLLAQHFRERDGQTPDWELEQFPRLYQDVAAVNQTFTRRLLSISPCDASLNALVGLDCFASAASFSGFEETLREFQLLFRAHLRSGKTPCS